jgi:hypothetical protein
MKRIEMLLENMLQIGGSSGLKITAEMFAQ